MTALTWSRLGRPVQEMLHKLRDASPEQRKELAAAWRALQHDPPTALDPVAVARLDEMVLSRLEPTQHGTDVHIAALNAVAATYCRDWFDGTGFAEHTAPWVKVFGEISPAIALIDWSEQD